MLYELNLFRRILWILHVSLINWSQTNKDYSIKKWKSKARVTSSNSRVTSSNSRVKRLIARVARLKARVARLKE